MTRPALLLALLLAGCGGEGLNRSAGGVFAPGLARGAEEADPLLVAARLMDAGEYELALDAYTRAASRQGLTAETLAGLGTANLRLGRLGAAEPLLRRAVAAEGATPQAWNNLGVLLMERRGWAEAAETFRRAYALDSGSSDTIRDNLRLALARVADPSYTGVNEGDQTRVIGYGSESPLGGADLEVEPL